KENGDGSDIVWHEVVELDSVAVSLAPSVSSPGPLLRSLSPGLSSPVALAFGWLSPGCTPFEVTHPVTSCCVRKTHSNQHQTGRPAQVLRPQLHKYQAKANHDLLQQSHIELSP